VCYSNNVFCLKELFFCSLFSGKNSFVGFHLAPVPQDQGWIWRCSSGHASWFFSPETLPSSRVRNRRLTIVRHALMLLDITACLP